MDKPISTAKRAAILLVSGAIAAHVSGWDQEMSLRHALAFVWIVLLIQVPLVMVASWASAGGERGTVR